MEALNQLLFDNDKIGTYNYKGEAYFWPHAMRHEMRDASKSQRKMFHDALVRLGFKADGVSYDRHIDLMGKNVEVKFCAEDAMYLTIDGLEWYVDNSTNEDIFEII
jgi:hypothetical protein